MDLFYPLYRLIGFFDALMSRASVKICKILITITFFIIGTQIYKSLYFMIQVGHFLNYFANQEQLLKHILNLGFTKLDC